MNDIAIQTHKLTRDFGSLRAVNNLDLKIEKGQVFGFLGPNGSGKTTTIRLLLGLLEPTAGRAEILGLDTRTQANQIRLRCGALLEHHGLYERLSAFDNLDFYARVWHIPKQKRINRIQELLEKLSLWERRSENVSEWSRGMKQKLAIARTLLHRPELIFLDEPTSGLDPVSAAAVRDDLAALADREGVTIFLTTHNLNEAEKLCHKVGVIREGRLLACGSLAHLQAQAAQPRLLINGSGFTPEVLAQLRRLPVVAGIQQSNGSITIDLKNQSETASLVNILVNAGVQVEEVHKSKVNLEEVFLSLMEANKDEVHVN
ncbi:MAG: ABC transporter ATP-binding protein [Anaerolineales bacterium]